jgi:hypothetical protein
VRFTLPTPLVGCRVVRYHSHSQVDEEELEAQELPTYVGAESVAAAAASRVPRPRSGYPVRCTPATATEEEEQEEGSDDGGMHESEEREGSDDGGMHESEEEAGSEDEGTRAEEEERDGEEGEGEEESEEEAVDEFDFLCTQRRRR